MISPAPAETARARRIADAASHHRRTTCRLCESTSLDEALSLTPTPPANAVVTRDLLDLEQPVFPLDAYLCRGCGHLQLLDIVDPGVLFEDYVYVSSTSPVMVAHLEKQAAAVIAQNELRPGDLVVEIGSNDGTLLRFFKQAGMRVLGVDPSGEISRRATESGIPTLNTFFTAQLAEQIRAEHGPAAAICANNVCAHIDDLRGVMRGVRALLDERGVYVFEVSYLLDVYEHGLFDTIYHEHVDYHRVGPMRVFLQAMGMKLVEAHRVPMQGGSLRGIATLAGAPTAVGASVSELEQLEVGAGLGQLDTYRRLAKNIARNKLELTSLLEGLKRGGKTIAGYGAPAKSTTLMYEFGLGRHVIDFIVEDNRMKQGMFTPGLHVPIVGAEELYARRPDYVVILAWNFAESIVARHERFTREGGRFVIPLPDLRLC